METEIRQYPVISELKEVQSRTQSVIERIEEDIEPAIHRQNANIHDLTVSVSELEERLSREVEVVSYEQLRNYNRHKKLLIGSIIYALISISAIVYLFLR